MRASAACRWTAPAQEAVVGIVDKIMTRIGAHDALQRGNSTFMVEMNETAHILSSQTSRSLILLDEVGRGTSTFDGISIAWSIVEYLYKPRGGAKVLFATHYFELVDLENKYPSIKNYHVEAKEYKDSLGESKLAFLYQILPGAADQSYGIHDPLRDAVCTLSFRCNCHQSNAAHPGLLRYLQLLL